MAGIKAQHPAPYLPNNFLAAFDCPRDRGTVSGRRTLAPQVESLDAPHYDDLVRKGRKFRKRRTAGEGSPPRKRRRKHKLGPARILVRDLVRYDNNHLVSSDDDQDGDSDQALFRPLDMEQTGLCFVEFDPHAPAGEDAGSDNDGSSVATSSVDMAAFEPTPGNNDDIFAASTPLGPTPSSALVWPELDVHYFGRGSQSFAVGPWLPDEAYKRLEDIAYKMERLFRSRDVRGYPLIDDPQLLEYQRYLCRLQSQVDIEMRESFKRPDEKVCMGPVRPFVNTSNRQMYPIDAYIVDGRWTCVTPSERGVAALIQDVEFSLTTAAGDVEAETDSDESVEERERMIKPRWKRRKNAAEKPHELKTRTLAEIADNTADSEKGPMTRTIRGDERRRFEDKLLAAFVSTRALIGGARECIDWGVLLKLFPSVTLLQLRRFWHKSSKKRSSYIARLTKKFQAEFLRAYEAGELPEIDYGQLGTYEWERLVEWTTRLAVDSDVPLPSSQSELAARFDLRACEHVADDEIQDKYYHPSTSIFARMDLAAATAAAIDVDMPPKASENDVSVRVARSWVRALCGMSQGQYGHSQIKAKLMSLTNGRDDECSQLLEKALRSLTHDRLITRVKKGPLQHRSYRLTEAFYINLDKLSQVHKYKEAVIFKRDLDSEFKRAGSLNLPTNMSDGLMMALINLQANGRVRVVPVNVPHVPYGFIPGFYETRKYPKDVYHFDLRVEPTEAYLYGNDMEARSFAENHTPPTKGDDGECPVWCNIFGQVDKRRWALMLGAFIFTMSIRGSMTAKSLVKALRPIAEEFEMQLMIQWSRKVGLLEPIFEGEGLKTKEWWWLIVGEVQQQNDGQLEPDYVRGNG